MLSRSGIYHIVMRGTDRRIIFSNDADCKYFLNVLENVQEKAGFTLFAWCLMGNHVHLLIKEGDEPLSIVFRRIGASYVYYYNAKYQLCGHLFQDRFHSEAVEDEKYLYDVLKYICMNPVKAGLCSKPFEYKWLACCGVSAYRGGCVTVNPTDIPVERMISFLSCQAEMNHIDFTGKKKFTDKEAIEIICNVCKCETIQEIEGWNKPARRVAIQKAIEAGIPEGQISRVTGICRTTIRRYIQ